MPRPRYNVTKSARAALCKLGLHAAVSGDTELARRCGRALAGEIHWVDLLGDLGELADEIDLHDNTITN